MDKVIRTTVPDTQQQFRTRVERDEDELQIKLRACSALDDELRSEFHDEIEALDTEAVSVRSTTSYSNQGNEQGQDVILRFNVDDQLEAIDVVNNVVQTGKEYYDRQLERRLGREEDDSSGFWSDRQLKYFDDQEVKEFCLLYQGRVSF